MSTYVRAVGGVCAVSLALVAIGCGSSEGGESTGATSASAVDSRSGDDETQIKQVLTQYGSAIADGDGDAACDVLTEELQREVFSEVSKDVSSVKSCAEALDLAAEQIGPDEKSKLRKPGVVDVQIQSDTASVRVEGDTSTPRLTKASGRWLIADIG